MKTVSVRFTSYAESIKTALDKTGAGEIIKPQSAILVKPNLVNNSPYPVTTHPECCAAVVEYIKDHCRADIVVAEGNGDPSTDTLETFRILGYGDLEKKYGVTLTDLNTAPLKRLTNDSCTVFPEMFLPEIAFTHFIISVPVLKAHSLSIFTGTLKNMIGFAPPEHYSGNHGVWKKAVFHNKIHQAILDLNRYRRPDLTVMDAVVGLADFHLGGRRCDPEVNRILAGRDPVAVDRESAALLGLNWRKIPHLTENLNE